MASTSINLDRKKYDAFISFRGADIRDGFLSHFYQALCRKQVHTFMDEKLERGEEISPNLLRNIEESNVSVVIFSENYASSPWCLDELVKIVQCKRMGHIVVPVFYQVDPKHVQELTGTYGDAFVKHLTGFKHCLDKVETWANALMETANISGWDSRVIKPESKLIEEIVNNIRKKLSCISPIDFNDGLVGIEQRAKEVESLLCIGSTSVCSVGIWGMGGIGKTTIAAAVFNRIFSQFEGHCFLANAREELETRTLIHVRDEILCKVLGEENLNIGTPNIPTIIRNKLQRKKILIVLDDVISSLQLISLMGEHDSYGPGSKIIITSRDKQVLKNGCYKIYEVQKLGDDEALQLFKLHAFKQNDPTGKYLELSKSAANYAKGIPLALKVLGSNLYQKGAKEWESELAELEVAPNMEVGKILGISYENLDRNEKSIFLDIACIFKGWDKDFVKRLLDDCGFFAKSGIDCLIDKSLITISNDKLEMHDLVQQMGRDIVYQEGITHPGKRSRLWKSNDIYHVFKNDQGTELVEVIKLDMSRIEDLNLSPTVFMKLYNLRCLQLGNCGAHRTKINLPVGLVFLPNNLRYLHWSRYTLKSLPSSFCPMNLLELHLRHSQLEEFWEGIQPLENLKYIDLSKSPKLVKIVDLSKFPNLEVLRLKGCRNLIEIHSSIQYDCKLFKVELDGCKNLCIFPSNLDFKNLKAVSVRDCSKIRDFLNKVPQILEKLDLSGTAIRQVKGSIGQLSQLVNLKLESCKKLKRLPNSIGKLRCLKELDLRRCSKLESLPDSICNLKSLKYLIVDDCVNLNRLPHKLGHLESLELLSADRSGLKRLPLSINQLRKLTHFFLKDCGILRISKSFGSLVSLTHLNLGENNFKSLPASIKQLSNLEILLFCNCKRLEKLPELPPALKEFHASNCTFLEAVPSFSKVGNKENVLSLNFANCFNLLGQNACNSIIVDLILRYDSLAQLDFHCLLASNLFNQEVASAKTGFAFALSSLCIPGNEVPQWFNCSSAGFLLPLIQHPCFHNIYFILVAFCAVVECEGYSSNLDVSCKCSFINEFGHRLEFRSTLGEHDRRKFCNILQNHIFFWYDAIFFKSKQSFKEVSFEFYTRYDNSDDHWNTDMIVECGVHLTFDIEGRPLKERTRASKKSTNYSTHVNGQWLSFLQ